MTLRFLGVILCCQIALTFLSAHFLNIHPTRGAFSLSFGSFLAFINLALLAYAWKIIILGPKKSVAWTVFLIVLKYGILIWVLVKAPKMEWFDESSFALGVLVHPIAVLIGGFLNQILKSKKA